MEQIIALVIFALIAVGGSLLRKHLEKQQREQQAAQRDARQKAKRQQRPSASGEKPSGPPRTFYGRPGETRPAQPAEPPARRRQPKTARRQPQQQPAAGATPAAEAERRTAERRTGRTAQHRRPRRAQPQHRHPPPAAEPAEATQEEAARRAVLQEARAGAARRGAAGASVRLGRLNRAKFPTLATMGHAGFGASTSATGRAAGRRGAGRVDYIGTMLGGRNVARAIVLSEILGPPKGLE